MGTSRAPRQPGNAREAGPCLHCRGGETPTAFALVLGSWRNELPFLRVERSRQPFSWMAHTHFTLSSRRSHAFASFQSRFTVSDDTPSTSAASSTVSPPKNRNSTT